MIKRFLVGVGIVIFLYPIFFDNIIIYSQKSTMILSLTIFMIILWIFSRIHYALIACLPFIFAPILNLSSFIDILSVIQNPVLPLIFGGMLIGLAFKKSNLHQRVSFFILKVFSNNLYLLILSFMMSSYILSITINNTAATMMGLMIALSAISIFDYLKNIKATIILAVVYGSLLGGNGTLISSPAVSYSYGFIQNFYDANISFAKWASVGLPISFLLVIISSLVLYVPLRKYDYEVKRKLESNNKFRTIKEFSPTFLEKVLYYFSFYKSKQVSSTKDYFSQKLKAMGKISKVEIVFALLLLFAVILWLTLPIINKSFPSLNLTDSYIAISISFLMFFIPMKKENTNTKFLLDFNDIKEIPWENFALIIGGLVLSYLWQVSNLSKDIISHMNFLQGINLYYQILFWVIIIFLFTEIMVNTVSISLILPLMCSALLAFDMDPFFLALIVGFAGNSAFILPTSTPSIALAWGENIDKKDLIKNGIIMKILIFFTIIIMMFYFL